MIRDSGARDARCPCGGGEPRFGTACFPRLAALARISHQDPGPSVPPARCATRSGPARRPPRRRRGCALRWWPLPRALRPGPCPSPAHTQRCNFAIASRFRDPTPGGASRRRARRGFPSSRVMAHGRWSMAASHRMRARCFGVFSTARLHMTPWNTARAYMASPHFRTGPRSTCAGTLEYARRGRHGERPEGR